jgi:spore coat polysaccharide biosynthesis protein SpsF
MNGIFITVRTGSTRLPNKALLTIKDKTTIEHLIERVKNTKLSDTIVLCTTTLPEDDILCRIAEKNNIRYYRGSVEDKLERWKGAAEEHNIDFFVTADGDDLFCEPELIDLAFKQYQESKCDFIKAEGVICGSFTYGIKTTALNKVCEIKDSENTEMMWVYFTDTDLFDVQNLKNIPDEFCRSDIRMTLDYQDDFFFFKNIFNSFDTEDFSLRDIVNLIDSKPELKEINFYLEEEWKNNQVAKTNLKLK